MTYLNDRGEPCSRQPQCGCTPDCGLHPNGCIYGGFSAHTGYWLIAEVCELPHPEPAPPQ